MSLIEILLIAIGLCFDTLAVSLVGGACMGKVSNSKKLTVIASFALFQGGFTFLGWALGSTFSHYIERYDHWVAFALLAYIGGEMIVNALRNKEDAQDVDLLKPSRLIISSIATSIDALAVGLSFAMLRMTVGRIALASLMIAAVTAIAAALGIAGGKKAARIAGRWTSLAGGIILLSIGVKILVEHLCF